jgi:hypothetical protein
MCVEALGCLCPASIPEFQLVDLKRAINVEDGWVRFLLSRVESLRFEVEG